jgi:hypothetical protein
LDTLNSDALKGLEDYVGKEGDKTFGFDINWFPRLWPNEVQCRDLEFPLSFSSGAIRGNFPFKVEFCDRVSGVRDLIYWIVYLVGVFYIFRRLVRFNLLEGK